MNKWRFLLSPEWLWRHSIAIGLGIQLWLNSHYITRAEYNADKVDLSNTLKQVTSTITELQWTMKLQASASERLSDHEARLRSLEAKRP